MPAQRSRVKIMVRGASLLALLTLVLAGCSTGAPTTPTTNSYRCGPPAALTVDHGVVYGAINGLGVTRFVALRASDGTVLWQNEENPYLTSNAIIHDRWTVAPVVDGQTVIETMGAGVFMALRTSDGTMLWHSQPLTDLATSVDGALLRPPVAVDGVIYAAVGYGTLAAWDERDGRTLWVASVAPFADTAQLTEASYIAGVPLPVVTGGVVYVSAGRSLYALHASKGWVQGSILRRLPDAPPNTRYSVPVVAAETVYVADSQGTVLAVTADTGEIRWTSPGYLNPVPDVRPTVVVQGQTVFVATQKGLVRALSTTTGAERWSYQTPNPNQVGVTSVPLAPLLVDSGRVYVESLAHGLYVLDAATGHEVWRAPLDSGLLRYSPDSPTNLSAPARDQEMVVVVATYGAEAWRVADGHELWVAHLPDGENSAFVQSVAVAPGMVYVALWTYSEFCHDNRKLPRMLGLRDTDGTIPWQVSI